MTETSGTNPDAQPTEALNTAAGQPQPAMAAPATPGTPADPTNPTSNNTGSYNTGPYNTGGYDSGAGTPPPGAYPPPAYGYQPYGQTPPGGNPPPAGQYGQYAPQQTWPPTTGRLTRSRSDRMLGGVCGGLARYWNTDPVLMRILAVVITLFTGGMFILVYLLAWIVIPDEPYGVVAPFAPAPNADQVGYASGGNPNYAGYAQMPAPAPRERSHLGWLVASIAILAAGFLGLVALFVPTGVQMFGITGGIMLAILGIGLLIGTTRGRARWLVIPAIPLAFITFGAVSAGNWINENPNLERWSDASSGVSVGDRTWEVTPADAKRGNLDYRLSAGSATLDLTGLSAPNKGGSLRVPIDAGVGLGELIVLVPDNVEVDLDATVRTGQMTVPGQPSQEGQNLDLQATVPARTKTPSYIIELDAAIGVGDLEVRHDAS